MAIKAIKKGRLVRRKLANGKWSKVYRVSHIFQSRVWKFNHDKGVFTWMDGPMKAFLEGAPGAHADANPRAHDSFIGYSFDDLLLIQRDDPGLLEPIK